MKNTKILYWDQGKSSFVKKDLEILRSEFETIDYTFKGTNNLLILLELFKQALISFYYVWTCRIVICQFAGYHSLIPFVIFKVFGKKRMIIAGGTDCVAFPSIRYGNFQKKYLKWFTRVSFRLADVIAPVDETLIKYRYTYQPNDYDEQGYRAFVKNIKAMDKVIYNGYDSDVFIITGTGRNEKSFLTVAANLNAAFAPRLKGIDLIIDMAKEFPDCVFSVVGGDSLQMVYKPDNLMLLGNIDNAKLVEVYNRHQFYLQLSMSEGFPNALCEAMLCGCIPIVSDVGAMRKIVSDAGFVLEKKDKTILKVLLNNVLTRNFTHVNYMRSRDRIRDNFTLPIRKQELNDLVNRLISND